MKLPHPIPYQGSKRNLADQILRLFPAEFDSLLSSVSQLRDGRTGKDSSPIINPKGVIFKDTD